MERYEIALPLRVPLNKAGTREFILNLNQYRNAHHQTLNPAKVKFKEMVTPLLARLPDFSTVELTYTVYHGNATLFDISNPCSVLDKFFSDALVEAGKLPDDNYQHVLAVNYRFGGIDRENPRCVVTITPIGPLKEEPMKVLFDHSDILAALMQRASEMITIPEGMEVQIIGLPDDFELQLDIVPAGTEAAPASGPLGIKEQVSTVKRTRRTKAEIEADKAKEAAAAAAQQNQGETQKSDPTVSAQAQGQQAAAEVVKKEDPPFTPDNNKPEETDAQQQAQVASAARVGLFGQGAGAGQGAPADDGMRPGPNGPAAQQTSTGAAADGGNAASAAGTGEAEQPRRGLFGNLTAVTNS